MSLHVARLRRLTKPTLIEPSWRAAARNLGTRRSTIDINVSLLAGASTAGLGLLVLIGWATGLDALRSMVPSGTTMKVNTALGFMAIGLAVVYLSPSVVVARNRKAAFCLLALAAIIALATSAEYAGFDLGIDRLPDRMSPFTALILLALAVAAFAAVMPRRSVSLVYVVCGSVMVMAVMSIVNYLFALGVPVFLAGYKPIAINTALAMGVVAFGIIGLLGRDNPFGVLAGPTATARLLRRLVAFFLVAPLILTCLRLAGQRFGLFDAGYGAAVMIVALMSLGLVVIIRSGRMTRDSDIARAALEMERDRFFELSLDMLSVIGLDGRFERVNRAWETTLGYRADELIGTLAADLVHPDDQDRTRENVRRHRDEGERLVGFHNRNRHRDGSYRWLEWMAQTEPDGALSFGVARDITDRKRDEDRRLRKQHELEARNLRLAERSVRDPLTGLHNRRFFDAATLRMEQRWKRDTTHPRAPVSVILFDLDHFGQVNKLHGHQAGDAVLRQFGALLDKRMRKSDLIARYGGEEFVAILEDARAADAGRIAEGIRVAFEGIAIDIGSGTPIRVTVSAGAAELGEGDSLATGIAIADVWLAQAKRAGRNQVVGAMRSGSSDATSAGERVS